MDSKNRITITAAILLLIGAALFTSFGRSLFALNTPHIVLPDAGAVGDDPGSALQDGENSFQWVEVAPNTVQAVIETLSRTESYHRQMTVSLSWGGGDGSSTAHIWADGGWTYIVRTLYSGQVRYDLVGPEEHHYWYEGDSVWLTRPAEAESDADLAQQLPTYETVLALDTDSITSAGYEMVGDFSCIYVEVKNDDLAYRDRYWVDVSTGLLIAAEKEKDGEIVYRVDTDTAIETPCPAEAEFLLPDRTEVRGG